MTETLLDGNRLVATIETLCLRIEDRFPEAGLLATARALLELARETDRTIRWIERPHLPIRIASYGLIGLLLALLAYTAAQFRPEFATYGFKGLVELSEAILNELVLLGAAVVFIVTFETRRKRRRVITSVNRLRAIAHIIDAHQLTKDPDAVSPSSAPTRNSPKRTLTAYELGRYLDYCSELLSLVGKLAFLYVQKFDDAVAVNAVNDLENLTMGMSRKLWQKIMILRTQPGTVVPG
jgi:hypothetical protein